MGGYEFSSYHTVVFIALVISFLFLLSGCLLYFHILNSYDNPDILHLPRSFSVITVLLLSGSFVAIKLSDFYKADKGKAMIGGMLIMTGIYLAVGMLLAYYLNEGLLKNGISLAAPRTLDAVTLISALFMAHTIAGIIYLIRYGSLVFRHSSDMVKSLLFFSDNLQRTRLKLLTIYWHYTTISWLFFFFVMVFTT